MSTKVVTGPVRLSFVHFIEPAADMNGVDKYSCMALIPKSDTATLKALHAAEDAAIEEAKSKRFEGSVPKKLKKVLRDSDEDLDTDKYPEAVGTWFMNVSSKTKPGLVDESLQPIIDPGMVYSGVHARLSVNAFAYNSSGTKGVTFFLNNAQILGYGEPLGGVAASAEDDFADFASNSDLI